MILSNTNSLYSPQLLPVEGRVQQVHRQGARQKGGGDQAGVRHGGSRVLRQAARQERGSQVGKREKVKTVCEIYIVHCTFIPETCRETLGGRPTLAGEMSYRDLSDRRVRASLREEIFVPNRILLKLHKFLTIDIYLSYITELRCQKSRR